MTPRSSSGPVNGDVVTFVDTVKNKVGDLADAARDGKAAHDEKAESDVESDSAVAGARDGDDGANGEYVGRTSPAFDAETMESGAEARSEEARDPS